MAAAKAAAAGGAKAVGAGADKALGAMASPKGQLLMNLLQGPDMGSGGTAADVFNVDQSPFESVQAPAVAAGGRDRNLQMLLQLLAGGGMGDM
jgi:hypothetical protein